VSENVAGVESVPSSFLRPPYKTMVPLGPLVSVCSSLHRRGRDGRVMKRAMQIQ
jgi:hypothetical protein